MQKAAGSFDIVEDGFVYRFTAMASPCEVRMETSDFDLAAHIAGMVEAEARRIELKYSRYHRDSVVTGINQSDGSPIFLDDETASLIDYAASIFQLSEGLFDITSGVLRRIWRFDGSDAIPSRQQIKELKPLIGWQKVKWQRPELILLKGMEIDLGGIGKEYAVDRAVLAATTASPIPILVNFGGDLRVSGPRASGAPWRAAIESMDDNVSSEGFLEIHAGAITTSGDARRFILKDGVRYSHILNPRTGWPVKQAPRSVTVAAATCIEAGLLSTLAMLHGQHAENFLRREGITAWWIR